MKIKNHFREFLNMRLHENEVVDWKIPFGTLKAHGLAKSNPRRFFEKIDCFC